MCALATEDNRAGGYDMTRGFAYLSSGIAALALTLPPLLAQTHSSKQSIASAKDHSWVPPRTRDGQPDLESVWAYATITPLERPRNLGDKAYFSEQELAEFEKETNTRRNQDRRDGSAEADISRAYNQFWWDFGTKGVQTRRTSLVIDPPDGRIPALTPEARKRAAARAAREARFDSWEDRPLQERCLFWSTAGPPMLPGAYNNNIRITQSAGYVVILNEMIHDARIVPLDGRPFGDVRQWMGVSRGRWEGNTLVVETRNFTDKTSLYGSGPNMKLTERFTRVAADMLLYEFTVDDPDSFTRPWTVQFPMTRSNEYMFEYACHEGNYSIMNALQAARAEETASEEAPHTNK